MSAPAAADANVGTLYLLDTNIINYLLKRVRPVTARFDDVVASDAVFRLSPLVHYEVVRYLKLRQSARLMRDYQRLVADWPVVEISTADGDMAADLWAQRHRAGNPIEDTDLLIAVTALKTGAILVTNNAAHFQNLGVALGNWA